MRLNRESREWVCVCMKRWGCVLLKKQNAEAIELENKQTIKIKAGLYLNSPGIRYY